MMSLVLVALVVFTYFGGQHVPKVLKDNKQMLLGVFVGVLLHKFMGAGIEGMDGDAVTTDYTEMKWATPVGNLMIGSTKTHMCALSDAVTISAPYTMTGEDGEALDNILHCPGGDDTPTATHICANDNHSFVGDNETGYICQ